MEREGQYVVALPIGWGLILTIEIGQQKQYMTGLLFLSSISVDFLKSHPASMKE
jgi:hypothetical protein